MPAAAEDFADRCSQGWRCRQKIRTPSVRLHVAARYLGFLRPGGAIHGVQTSRFRRPRYPRRCPPISIRPARSSKSLRNTPGSCCLRSTNRSPAIRPCRRRPTAKRLPRVVAVEVHVAEGQIDRDLLAKLFSGLVSASSRESTGSELDHRIITDDEINPSFMIAPVSQAVQKSRIGHCPHRGGSSGKPRSEELI